ncbi:hypothetical protein J6590_043988 [Homalodisca vitripennis]|nr:hypothetical protein J6590_043988 [Homalodisca vitripennis]
MRFQRLSYYSHASQYQPKTGRSRVRDPIIEINLSRHSFPPAMRLMRGNSKCRPRPQHGPHSSTASAQNKLIRCWEPQRHRRLSVTER